MFTVNQEYLNVHNILVADVRSALDELRKLDTPFKRRTFVHTLFAFIEGEIYRRKQVALAIYDAHGVAFSEAEIAMLKEKSYDLDRRGKVTLQQKFLRLENNLKFSFDVFARSFNTKFEIQLENDNRWESFLKAIEIRNKITHPKNETDLIISDTDLEHIQKAFHWFAESSNELFNIVSAAHERKVA